MKECPFCKAQIEENARFCLYCMKPLVEKEVVAPAREKRRRVWLLPMLAVVLLLSVLAAVLLLGNSKEDLPVADTTAPIAGLDPEDPPATEETDSSTVTTPTQEPEPPIEDDPTQETKPPVEDDPTQGTEPPIEDDPTQGTEPPIEDNPTPPVTEDPPCTHNYLLQTEEKPTCTLGGVRHFVCSECDDVMEEKTQAAGHRFNDATCELPKTCKVCQTTEGAALGHSYKDNTCTRCGDKQVTDTEPDTDQTVKYEYRLAEADDLKSDTYVNDGNDIVITGVVSLSPTGEYTIPSYIDGKRVVAIMPYAFRATNVTKVVLGSTIRVIGEYAFFACYDLADIYFAGEYLDAQSNSFPTPAERNGTLTIHCSATCKNAYSQLYKNMGSLILKIVWAEWNGEL